MERKENGEENKGYASNHARNVIRGGIPFDNSTKPNVNYSIQGSSERTNPNVVRDVPMNQPTFQQQQQHLGNASNHQQQPEPRHFQNNNQIRFANNAGMSNLYAQPRFGGANSNFEPNGYPQRYSSPNIQNQQVFLEKKNSFSNLQPLMQPSINEKQNWSNQPPNQNPNRPTPLVPNLNQSNVQSPPNSSIRTVPKDHDPGDQMNKVSAFSRENSNSNFIPSPQVNGDSNKFQDTEINKQNARQIKNLSETVVEQPTNNEKENIQEENIRNKRESFSKKQKPTGNKSETSGIVRKNIKYFEERDTAKTPLVPCQIAAERRESKLEDKDKKSTKGRWANEGGVDDAPMHHPNLRNVSETPFKMIKIPLYKDKSTKRGFVHKDWSRTKPNWLMEKSSRREKTKRSPSEFKRPEDVREKSKMKKFRPDEELLAFFYNSKLLKLNSKRGETKKNRERSQSENRPFTNGDIRSPQKIPSKLPGPTQRAPLSSPTDGSLRSPGASKPKSLPKTPENPAPPTPTNKKLPMNKIQVGSAPSPNLRAAKSKVGSLVNTTHKPGGGNVRIESHKIDFSKTQSRIEAKNDQYVRSGGEKKIPQVKLQWEAKSKVGSLENTTYKPGGGDKKIESIKLDFKERAKSKVGSKDNVKHVPGGGTVKIESQKLEFKAQSKVGSLDNVKHKPGGGDVKIFDDKTYLKQISACNSEGGISGTQNRGEFRAVRERKERSVPSTPSRRPRIKIRSTSIVSDEVATTPTTENIEKSFLAFTKEGNSEISKPKHEIKVTYLTTDPEKMSGQGFEGTLKSPTRESVSVFHANSENRNEGRSFGETGGKSVVFVGLNSKE